MKSLPNRQQNPNNNARPSKKKAFQQYSFKREIFILLELSLLNASCQSYFSLAVQRQEHKNALVFLTDLASKVGEDAKDLKVCPKDGCVGENSESITRFSSKWPGFLQSNPGWIKEQHPGG